MIGLDILKKFCADEVERPTLSQPFSFGEFAYATNGHIAIRVPVIEGVQMGKEGFNPNPEFIFQKAHKDAQFKPHQKFELPKIESKTELCECQDHDCPSCCCPENCEDCGGSGSLKFKEADSVNYEGVFFDTFYFELIQSLPNLQLPTKAENAQPLPFVFEGVRGILMPLRHAWKSRRFFKEVAA